MNVTALEPVGAIVTELALRDTSPADVTALTTALAEHGMLAIPDQHLDDDEFVSFLRRFGTLTFTTGETPVDGFCDLNVVTNVGRTTPPRSTFHTDTSYVRRPPRYTALRAVAVPTHGGDTLFSNQYRAYVTLPDHLRELLAGRTVSHVVTGLDLDDDAETSARHPLFRVHPVSGRTSIYLSAPERCRSISGLSDSRSHEIIRFLFEHSTSHHNVHHHRWSPGDVVIWDNGCVMHRADHSDVVGDRTMHRGMVLDSTIAAVDSL